MSRTVRLTEADLARLGVKRRGAKVLRARACPDCGAVGERRGHQTCEYPTD